MLRKRETLLAVSMLVLAAVPQTAARADEALPPAAEWVPRQAVFVLNVSQPKAVLDMIVQPKLIEAIESSAAYQAQAATPGFREFQTVVRFIEGRFKANWRTILARATGGGVTWALGPRQTSLLIIDALDAETPRTMHDLLLFMVESEAEKQGRAKPTSSVKHGDVTIWSVGPNEAHAIVGRRLMVANSPAVLKAALDLRGGPAGGSVASLDAYRQAARTAGSDALATVYLNTGVLKKLPGVAKALTAEGNPLLALLAAPVTEALASSTWAGLALKAKGDTLTLEAASDGTITPGGVARFAVPPQAGGGAMPNLAVPRRIAAMSLYRDLKGFYAAKDTLFPERTSGLIFFENMMGIFFTGRDLTEEVLAELGPRIRLVVAGQKYDQAVGTPAVQIPAFALVMPLKNAKRFSPVVEEAWQKAVGLINFTRGQKALPGLIIDRPVHGGVKYTVAGFAAPEVNGKTSVDVRFNFRPALATASGHLILSSTDALAEDLMDALASEASRSARPPDATHSLVEIDGAPLAAILAANRENFVRQNMVDKGHTRKQAENEVNTLLAVVKHVSHVSLTFGADRGRSTIRLKVRFALPAAGRGDSGDK